MIEIIDSILSTTVYLLSSYAIFFLGKYSYHLFNPKINVKDELVEKDNFAFSVAHVGYFIGLLFTVGSAIIGPSKGILIDLLDIFVYGILGILLLNISIKLNDIFILSKFSVHKEIIEDRNTGTGIVEAASSIANGLIIWGALSGIGGSILTAVVFWMVGQVLLIIASLVYNLITPYDVHEHIEKDNVAVGIGFAGALVSLGVLLRFALIPDFVSWEESLVLTLVDFLIGIVFLPIARFIADKILLPGRNLTDELINQEKPNYGVALIEAFSYIGGAVFITWVL